MKIISEQKIRNLQITPGTCVDWILESFSIKRDSQLPAKISVHPNLEDFYTSMPCLLPPPSVKNINNSLCRQYFGVKVVHRLVGAVPSLGSDMMLYDAGKGTLLAMIDCDWITTMRTGAVAAVSAKALRRHGADTYGFVGLGNTACATLLCVLAQEPDKHFEIKLQRYKNQAELFIARFKDYPNVSFEIMDSLESMLPRIDVLISCITSAHGLLVEDVSLFPPGITVIPVHMRGFQNCDTSFDRVFGDDTEHVKGFKYFPLYQDYNEIGEVLSGRDPGRRSDSQRIIDYNYGLALHDVLYASKIFEMLENDASLVEIPMQKETSKVWI